MTAAVTGYDSHIHLSEMNSARHHYYPAIIISLILFSVISLPSLGAAPVYKTRSILAEGKWTKVRIPDTGLYRLSNERLAEWGFNNPESIVVAGYGSVERAHTLDSAPDDLPVIPVIRTDDAVYFYAEGDTRVILTGQTGFTEHRNYYSSGSYYFIGESSSDPSPDMASRSTTPSTTLQAVETHESLTINRIEETVADHAGVFFFSRDFADSHLSVDFDISGIESDATLSFYFIGKHSESTALSPEVNVTGDASVVSTSYTPLRNASLSNWLYRRSDMQKAILSPKGRDAGNVTVTFSDNSGRFSNLALDYASLRFKKSNVYTGVPMIMDFYGVSATQPVHVSGLDDNALIVDVTEPRDPMILGRTDGTFAGLTASRHSRVLAFTPSGAIPEPEAAGFIAPKATDLHAMESVDMLIVTTAEAYEPALRLANAHEKVQGFKVAVVKQSDIFDQFSSGALHPSAIRSFARLLYSRTDRPLRYLLLIGDSYFDTRHVTLKDNDTELLTTYHTEDYNEAHMNSKDYCSDSYFGMFIDKTQPSLAKSYKTPVSIGIGRIPYTGEKLEKIIDKTISYLEYPHLAGEYTNAIVWGGLGDTNQHIEAAESVANIITNRAEGSVISKPHHALFQKTGSNDTSDEQQKRLSELFASRPYYINYNGHGSHKQIDHYDIRINNTGNFFFGSMPVMMLSSCTTTAFDTSRQSFSLNFLSMPSGPIAVIGACRSVYMTYNGNLANEFSSRLYTASAGDCLGDVFKRALTTVNGRTEQQCINNLCYNLVGDPAIPVPTHTGRVEIQTVDGSPLSGPLSLTPLHPTVVSGYVTDKGGNFNAGFDGTLTMSFLSAPITQKTLAVYDSKNIKNIVLDETVLFTTAVEVKAGRWEATITPPSTSFAGRGRLSLCAIDANRSNATGEIVTDFNPGSGSTSAADTSAPVITISINGAEASPVIPRGFNTLEITVTDEGSGAGLIQGAIGGHPVILRDGEAVDGLPAAFRPISPETITLLTTVFEAGSPGHHILTVKVSDMAGNQAVKQYEYTVSDNTANGTMTVDNDICSEYVTFALEHTMDERPAGRLIIRDLTGNTVATANGISFPYEWDLRDNRGELLPDGTYRASALLDTPSGLHTHTDEVKFTIVKQ